VLGRKVLHFKNVLFVALFFLAVVIGSAPVRAEQSSYRYDDESSAEFRVSAVLRGRVDFWKDIFTRYGAAQMVVHHRDFPQIVFGVIDLSKEKATLTAAQFEKHKSNVAKSTIKEIEAQLQALAKGENVESAFQARVKAELLRRGLPVSDVSRWVKDGLIRTQTGIRERYAEAIQRAWRYMPVMEEIFVKEFGLPKELTRLPFIESSFDYSAHSSVGAAGIWQFMPRTARVYKMAVGRYVDERRDPIKATRAAAKYLKTAYDALGSWPLAIVSYNHGVGGVRKKLKHANTRDLEAIIEDPNERYFGFASTNFYPEFLAAIEVYENHQQFFPEVKQLAPLEVASYRIPRSVAVGSLIKQLGVSVDELKEANYALLNPVWSGRARIPAGYTFHVPVQYKSRGDAVLQHFDTVKVSERSLRVIPVSASASTSNYYRVRRGDSLYSIARKHGISVAELKSRNDLSTSRIYTGQKLQMGGMPEKAESQGQYRTIKIQRGDSLGKLAERYGVSVQHMRELNALKSNLIKVGQSIRVPIQ
jgi:membrane-bound lytic murein transglycosylase D